MEYHLTLKQQRLDYIMQVLATRPYAEVCEVIGDIAMQVSPQQSASALGQMLSGNGHDVSETPS